MFMHITTSTVRGMILLWASSFWTTTTVRSLLVPVRTSTCCTRAHPARWRRYSRPINVMDLHSSSKSFHLGAKKSSCEQDDNEPRRQLARRPSRSFQRRSPDPRHTPSAQQPAKNTTQSLSRTGCNSYLKVVLAEDSMTFLHEISLQIQQHMNNHHDAANQSTPMRLTFRPRSQESLHMTLLFGGTVLCALEPPELRRWHAHVRNRLEEDQFVLRSSAASSSTTNPSDDKNNASDDWTFELQDICTFPPHRHDLIVAKFRAGPKAHALYRDLRRMTDNIPALQQVTQQCSKESWVAHVTLGNKRVSRGDDDAKNEDTAPTRHYKKHTRRPRPSKQELQENVGKVLRELFLEESAKTDQVGGHEIADSARDCLPPHWRNKIFPTQGIRMGGPVPVQCDLDWNFYYLPVKSGRA